MRFCYSDAFGGPVRNMSPGEAAWVRDLGFTVAGINSGSADATDADIERAKRILDDHGLAAGPFGSGTSTFHPDDAECRRMKDQAMAVLAVAGKIGCTNIRISAGSFHPTNRWMHHPGNHTQKALDLMVENTLEVRDAAEKARCCITPETTQWTIINTIDRMAEFVDRLDSPYVKVIFDPVNHMTPQTVYDSGRAMKRAVAELGDRIAEFHVKDVMVDDQLLVAHIDETPMGTGVLDHAALLEASTTLEGWKNFSLEHIRSREAVKPAADHILNVAKSIGYRWTPGSCTRERWDKGEYR